MHKAISKSVVFVIRNDKSPSFLQGKYRVGRILNGVLNLSPMEAMYLFIKKRIVPENPSHNSVLSLINILFDDDRDLDVFRVYEYLKNNGLVVKIEKDRLFFMKQSEHSYTGPVIVRREFSEEDFSSIYSSAPSIYSVIDEQNDLTVFRTSVYDPVGSVEFSWPEKIEAKEIGTRYVVSRSGLPQWFGEEMGDAVILSSTDYRVLSFISGPLKKFPESFSLADMAYLDLLKRRCIVKTGFKYGANFRVYLKSMEDHAELLISVLEKDEWYRLSRAIRVAHAVRKKMVFAGIIDNELKYVIIERISDILSSAGKQEIS
jgi:tRNA-intron endonuclease